MKVQSSMVRDAGSSQKTGAADPAIPLDRVTLPTASLHSLRGVVTSHNVAGTTVIGYADMKGFLAAAETLKPARIFEHRSGNGEAVLAFPDSRGVLHEIGVRNAGAPSVHDQIKEEFSNRGISLVPAQISVSVVDGGICIQHQPAHAASHRDFLAQMHSWAVEIWKMPLQSTRIEYLKRSENKLVVCGRTGRLNHIVDVGGHSIGEVLPIVPAHTALDVSGAPTRPWVAALAGR